MMDWESLAQLSFEDTKDGPRCPDGHQPSFCLQLLTGEPAAAGTTSRPSSQEPAPEE